MIKSKIIDALKALNKNELKEFDDFVRSPFFNKNKNLVRFFDELKPFYPSFDNKKLTKELLYSGVFPGKEYSDKTFRNMSSDLLALIEKYLSVSLFNSNPFYEKYLKVASLLKKSLYNLTETNIKEAGKLFEDVKFDGGNILYIMHLIEMEKDFLAISKNKLINLNMNEGEYLILSFITKFLIFKMKFYNYRYKLGTEKLSQFIIEFEKSINIESFIKYLETRSEPYIDIILIYYYCTKFMNDINADSYYNKVKPLLKKNMQTIVRSEIINVYLTLNAFCVAKIRNGNTAYERELFDLYRDMIAEKLLIGEGEFNLHITIYNNIVSMGLKQGEPDWVINFIENHTSDLLPEFRDTMRSYSYAQYYFYKKEFEKALQHINKVNFENYYIKSGVRILLLKIYFELRYTESFYSLSDTLKHYLSSDKQIPEDRRIVDYNFVTLANKAYKYCLEHSKSGLDELKNEISLSRTGTHKEWLNEKIIELENKISR